MYWRESKREEQRRGGRGEGAKIDSKKVVRERERERERERK